MEATAKEIKALAKKFSEMLFDEIGKNKMVSVIISNMRELKEGNSICHTHDFCDANQVMLDACEALGLTVDLDDSGENETEEDAEWEAQQRIMDAAWNLAKVNRFLASKIAKYPFDQIEGVK